MLGSENLLVDESHQEVALLWGGAAAGAAEETLLCRAVSMKDKGGGGEGVSCTSQSG